MILLAFFILASMGTSHSRSHSVVGSNVSLFLFPYASAFTLIFGSLVGSSYFFLISAAILLLGQAPIYGFLIGMASYNERLRKTLWSILIVHVIFYAIASFAAWSKGDSVW